MANRIWQNEDESIWVDQIAAEDVTVHWREGAQYEVGMYDHRSEIERKWRVSTTADEEVAVEVLTHRMEVGPRTWLVCYVDQLSVEAEKVVWNVVEWLYRGVRDDMSGFATLDAWLNECTNTVTEEAETDAMDWQEPE